MSPGEKQDIQDKMAAWFDQKVDAAKSKKNVGDKPLNLLDKLLLWSDEWWFRVILAALFVFVVNWIQNFINADEPDEHDLHDYDELEMERRERRR